MMKNTQAKRLLQSHSFWDEWVNWSYVNHAKNLLMTTNRVIVIVGADGLKDVILKQSSDIERLY